MPCLVMVIFHLLCQLFRVHGKKVAEIPLVGTRLQYRRHGMCRILVNELEKVIHKTHIPFFLLSFTLVIEALFSGITVIVYLCICWTLLP